MNKYLTTPIGILAFAATPLSAATVVDDHFDDSSTTGWTENPFGANGSIIESGSSVIMTSTRGVGGGGAMVMTNNNLLDSSGNTPISITVSVDSISGTDPDGRFLMGMLDEGFAGFFVLNARVAGPNLELRIEAGSPGGGGGGPAAERRIPLAPIPYTPTTPYVFTFNFDSDSVSVTEGGGYNSGDLLFANSFQNGNGTPVPGYNPLGLLSADSNLALVASTETDQSNLAVSINRVTVNGVAAPVPEPTFGALFGSLALLVLVRKRTR